MNRLPEIPRRAELQRPHLLPQGLEGVHNAIAMLLGLNTLCPCTLCNLLAMLVSACHECDLLLAEAVVARNRISRNGCIG